jgi:hypothetical protein
MWILGTPLLLGAVSMVSPRQDRAQARVGPESTLGPSGLRGIALDLLGRPPFPTELATWSPRPRHEIVDECLASNEAWEWWLEEQLFYFLLIDNFRPSSESVRNLPRELAAGRIGARDALHRIALCPSFDRRNPGADTFVTVVLEQYLGIDVQKAARELAIGKKVYEGGSGTFLGRSGNSQSDVVRIALEDRRALEHFLRREHERLLREAPTEVSLSAWTIRLEHDPLAYRSIVREWLLSEAYERRLFERQSLPNRMFVRALFVDLTQSLPDERDARRLRAALDGLADARPLRSVIARTLIDSGRAIVQHKSEINDPGTWVSGLFERMLGRRPSAAELAEFMAVFQDEACRPETILYAIVTHPEYQTW